MVSADANRVLTESGPGTPGGHILRQYWQPAALTEELASDRPLVPVTLMRPHHLHLMSTSWQCPTVAKVR